MSLEGRYEHRTGDPSSLSLLGMTTRRPLFGMARQYSELWTAPWLLPPWYCDWPLLPDD